MNNSADYLFLIEKNVIQLRTYLQDTVTGRDAQVTRDESAFDYLTFFRGVF